MRSDFCGMVSLLTPFIEVYKSIEKQLPKLLSRGFFADRKPKTAFGIDIPNTWFVLFPKHLHSLGLLLTH